MAGGFLLVSSGSQRYIINKDHLGKTQRDEGAERRQEYVSIGTGHNIWQLHEIIDYVR